jgi:serine protease Do
MIRTLLAALLLTGLTLPSASVAGAQPEPQPQPQPQPRMNPVPAPRAYIAGRSYLGVDIRDITQDRVAPLKLKEERGVEITMVDQDAPAGKAGLREHDVILDFNGAPVESEEQLRRLIRETPPGRTISLGISRDGNPMKINVQLADHSKIVAQNRTPIVIPPIPEMPDLPNRFDIPGNIYVLRNSSAVLGVQTENLTRQLGEFFGVKNGEGVLIRSVEKGSPAEKGGLKAGDVIVRVGDEKLSDRSDFARVMRNHRSGGKLTLGVVRDKREQTLTVDLPDRGTKDSSKNEFDLDEFNDAMGDLQDLVPELQDSFDSTHEIASLSLNEDWQKSMQQFRHGMDEYRKAMKGYKGQFKDLQKQLQQQQKDLQKLFHPML